MFTWGSHKGKLAAAVAAGAFLLVPAIASAKPHVVRLGAPRQLSEEGALVG